MKICIVPPDEAWFTNKEAANKWVCLDELSSLQGEDGFVKVIEDTDELENIDLIIFIGFYKHSYPFYIRLIEEGLIDRAVYWMLEPEVVATTHNREGLSKYLRRFKFVLTWNEELIDDNRVFFLNIPYKFKKSVVGGGKTGLITNISANKKSKVAGELYSERERVIRYFGENKIDDFTFYGYGFDELGYKNYGGVAASKEEVYSRFKFALCLENASLKNYVTEKIIDCLTSLIVPIYKGATNISEYIPSNLFIDYDSFKTTEEMYHYLKNMSDDEYATYIDRIKNFLETTDEIKIFSAKEWDSLLKKAYKKSINYKFSLTKKEEFEVLYEYIVLRIKLPLHKIKKRLLKILGSR